MIQLNFSKNPSSNITKYYEYIPHYNNFTIVMEYIKKLFKA
jgi:serine/threonine protein kinase